MCKTPISFVVSFLLLPCSERALDAQPDTWLGSPQLVADLNTRGDNRSSSDPRAFHVVDGQAFFTAHTPQHGRELWVTDGTEEGTHIVFDAIPGRYPSTLRMHTDRNGSLVFSIDTSPAYGLWRSDGTPSGTRRLFDTSARDAIVYNGDLYFSDYSSGLWKIVGDAEPFLFRPRHLFVVYDVLFGAVVAGIYKLDRVFVYRKNGMGQWSLNVF